MNRKDIFSEGEFYHLYNRGVEKRDIFSSDADHKRWLSILKHFNDETPAEHVSKRLKFSDKNSEVAPRNFSEEKIALVDILAYCLVPNHYHLLVHERREGGIVEFMRKIGTGYTMYFNKKYERVGPLFQGRFKSSHVARNEYFQYIPHYIHLNALDALSPGWKNRGNTREDIRKIESYTWSSAKSYLDPTIKDEILNKELIREVFGEQKEYREQLAEMLSSKDSMFSPQVKAGFLI